MSVDEKTEPTQNGESDSGVVIPGHVPLPACGRLAQAWLALGAATFGVLSSRVGVLNVDPKHLVIPEVKAMVDQINQAMTEAVAVMQKHQSRIAVL